MPTIMTRVFVEVNTDPQSRRYDGCHFSSEQVWTSWAKFEYWESPEVAKQRLKFWTDLNEYAVSQSRKQLKREYKLVDSES